jgi:hypothetical protein
MAIIFKQDFSYRKPSNKDGQLKKVKREIQG